MMAAFYSNLAARAEVTELKGKLGLKLGQLEESVAQELRFLDFVKDLDIGDPDLYKGSEE